MLMEFVVEMVDNVLVAAWGFGRTVGLKLDR